MLQSTLTKVAVCATGGAVAAMSLAGTATAVSETSAAAPVRATVTQLAPEKGGGKVYRGYATRNVRIHQRASSNSPTIGVIRRGSIVQIKCKVRTQWIPGSTVWFKLAKRTGWVNARYIRTWDRVPYCSYLR